jgi:hypothetical protein
MKTNQYLLMCLHTSLGINMNAYAADVNADSYYVERRSYGTSRDTEPPRYVKPI